MAAMRLNRRLETGNIEPDIFGNYQERSYVAYEWMCTDCGLVWTRKWHAETCAERKHVSHWLQRYPKGPIVNGKPSRVDEYPRDAIRRQEFAF